MVLMKGPDWMDQNTHSRFSETKEELLVRVAPLDGAVQVDVPFTLRQDLLRLEHDVVRAGHPGVNRMYAAIRRHYYWESMAADVYDWVASCASCARNRIAPRRRTAMLKLFPATDPFASLSMDLLEPLTETKTGNVFLLIIVDRFSKLVRAVPRTRWCIDGERRVREPHEREIQRTPTQTASVELNLTSCPTSLKHPLHKWPRGSGAAKQDWRTVMAASVAVQEGGRGLVGGGGEVEGGMRRREGPLQQLSESSRCLPISSTCRGPLNLIESAPKVP